MDELLDKHIRISARTKYRLDELKKSMSYNAYITEMLDYFEVTCTTPRVKIKNPTARIEKRMEDLIKIVKSQEKDIFRPLLDRSFAGNGIVDSEQMINLANENKQLKAEIERCKISDGTNYKEKLDSLVELINLFCNKNQFKKSAFGNDLQVPESFFDKLIEKINKDYVL
mgnify:FL=1|jgi:hypothetical protein